MQVVDILRKKALEYGIPFEIVYSVVGLETGGSFDPKTVGDGGDSFGLFQINKPSHPSFDTSRYTDVTYQADFQLPELKQYYDKGYSAGLRGVELAKYVEVYGQRPAYSDPNVKAYVDSAIPKYYNQATGGNIMTVANDTNVPESYLGKQLDSLLNGLPDIGGIKEKLSQYFDKGIALILLIILYLGIGILFFVAIYQIFK